MGQARRLKSGNLLEVAPGAQASVQAPDQLQKRTILVHAGEFQSMDGPIEFDAKRIQRVVENQNTALKALAESYGGIEKMPLGAFPPILEDHEEKNQKIIGRLSGLLEYAEMDIPGVGSKVPAAVGTITFIGKENTQRVLDGRIYHVSIGIDTESDTLSETSVVVTPAAPGAMLLSRGKADISPTPTQPTQRKSGESKMPHASQNTHSHKERLARLSAIRGEIDKVNKTISSSQEVMRLKAREAKVTHRLKAAVQAGKMSPAEFKRMTTEGDLTKLAKMSEEASEMVLQSFEKREAVIEPGQRGSADALEGGAIAKEIGMKRLKAETRADILAGGSVKRLKKMDGEKDDSESEGNPFEKKASAKSLASDPTEKDDKADLSGKDVAQASATGVYGDEAEKKMSELEGQVAQLQALVAKLMDEVQLSVGGEEDEADPEKKELAEADTKEVAGDEKETEKDPPAKGDSSDESKKD